MHIEQSPEEIRKERVFSLEAEAEMWKRLAIERSAEIEDQKTTINTLNDHYFKQKEEWEEKEEVWRLRAERQDQQWQAVHDREIVMGEKIKDLKRYAELFGPDPILCDKIQNL